MAKFAGTKEQHRAKSRIVAGELRHDIPLLRRNIADRDCHRAFSRLMLISNSNGEFLTERAYVSRKRVGVSRQLETLKKQFAQVCLVKD